MNDKALSQIVTNSNYWITEIQTIGKIGKKGVKVMKLMYPHLLLGII